MTISPDPVQLLADGSQRIDAATTLSALASDPIVREAYPLLALACETSASAGDVAIRDDLAQRGYCPWLERGAACLKNGGTRCFAPDGDNVELSIVEGGPSWIVHPSEVGVALVALDATILIAGAAGSREVPASGFFVLPTERLDTETVLRDDEVVVAVRLPAAAAGGVQRFYRSSSLDGSLRAQVSLAAARRTDGEGRLVLGRVSPRPYRVYNSIEEEMVSGGLDEETIEGLAYRALLDAEPLSENAFKLELAEGLLRDAIRELSAEP